MRVEEGETRGSSRADSRRQQFLSAVMGDRDTDPRVWQGTFLGLMLLAVGLLVVGGIPVTAGTSLGRGALAATGLTGLALVVPWRRVPRWWVMALPVADTGVLGLAGLDDAGEAVAPMLVIPAIWSALEQGRRAVWATGGATLLLYGVPGVVATGGGGASLA